MNPRVKKILRNMLFLLSIPLIVVAFVFANSSPKKDICKGFQITIDNPELSFVTKGDILSIMNEHDVLPNQTVIHNVALKNLELAIKENPWVEDAELFVSANHTVNVNVKQRVPIVRINQLDSSDYAYYLDEHANPIQFSEKYIPQVPIVTSPDLGYSAKELSLKTDLVALANFIQKDSFWNAMITQINVNSKLEVELIPAWGNHLILMGDISNFEPKMAKLLAFYQNGIQTIDWNKYNEIDVRFEHQIVARNTTIAAFAAPQKEDKEVKATPHLPNVAVGSKVKSTSQKVRKEKVKSKSSADKPAKKSSNNLTKKVLKSTSTTKK